jgi:ribosomal protein S18 acetylase RimI-like enzyme
MHAHSRLYQNDLAALERIAHIAPGSVLHRTDRWIMLNAAVPEVPAFNVAVPASAPLEAADVQDVLDWFTGREIPFRIRLRDNPDAAALERLRKPDFVDERVETAYMLEDIDRYETAGGRPAGLEVRLAKHESDVADYGRVGWEDAGLPQVGIAIARTASSLGFALLLGSLNGNAVASSMAVVAGDVVGVYNVTVKPTHRGRGIGSRMVFEALSAGRARGAKVAYLSAPDSAGSLCGRLGFRPVFRYLSFSR